MISKFKAYIKAENRIVEVELISFRQKYIEYYPNEKCGYRYEFSEIQLLQWTGLKDKDGVDIYTYDVLHEICTPNDEEYIRLIDDIRTIPILWHNPYYDYPRYKIKNLGSSLTNPELLKEKKI